MKQSIELHGAKIKEVRAPQEIFEDVFTTGELDNGVKEQSLLIKTSKGLVVITGCAHPGVVNIVKRAKEIAGDKIYLLVGGFHLLGAFPSQIDYIAQSLRKLGVERVAPCHCSGAEARKLLTDYFGEACIDFGVGREIII